MRGARRKSCVRAREIRPTFYPKRILHMPVALPATIWANHRLEWGQQTYVMGIINVTPDSFSGDGLIEETLTPEAVVARAVAQAQQFVAEGATMIDVGGESTRPNFAPISTELELARVLPVVLMANMRGYQKHEIVSDVIRFLAHSIDLALAADVAWERIIIDPGIGFGTTPEENLTLLHRFGELRALGRPILLGTSRKSPN